jgi:methyl-accepting chemotaxis protein
MNTSEQEQVTVSEQLEGSLSEICLSTLPVWANQIESARKITDESIQDLSQRFYGLSQRIQSTVSVSTQNDSNGGLLGLLQDSQNQLTSIIGLLKTSMEEKAVLVKAILDLSSSAKDLMDMANVVSLIARETNMVAINAAIEAAHVGEKGRGFAVVADSVRLLSANAAKTGKQISERVMSVTKAINVTAQISKEFEEKDHAMVEQTEQIIAQVVDQFGNAAKDLMDSSEQLRTEGQYVSGEISNVLVSLQFQDRVTQMLSHVQNDLYKLQNTIAAGDLQVDGATWLQELAATYTMQEQHEIQAEVTGEPVVNTRSKKSGKKSNVAIKENSVSDGDEITFF